MRSSFTVLAVTTAIALACKPRDSAPPSTPDRPVQVAPPTTPASASQVTLQVMGAPCLDSLTTRDTLVFSNLRLGTETGDLGGTEFYFTRTPTGEIVGAHRVAEGALDSTYYPLAAIRFDSASGALAFDIQLRGWTATFKGSFACDSLSGVLTNWGKSVWPRVRS